jgi:hypothetical protein
MKYLHHLEQPLDTFVFMGCWNKTGCATGSAQQTVLRTLVRQHGHVGLLVLGGDNVYPDKVDGSKQYSVDRLEAGFTCVKETFGGTLLVALGNHNVATPALRSGSLAQGLTGEPYSLVVFSNRKAIMTLDTNAPFPFGWIAEALAYMREHHIRDYYVVMHEPLVGFKQKKVQILKEGEALLATLAPQPPLLILTADVHSYQKIRIQFGDTTFVQVISGTGGATLDPLPAHFPETVDGFSGRLTVEDAHVAYGYQVISGADNEFVVARLGSPKHSPSAKHGHTKRNRKSRKNRKQRRRNTRRN